MPSSLAQDLEIVAVSLQATAGLWKNKDTVENVLLILIHFFHGMERPVIFCLSGFPLLVFTEWCKEKAHAVCMEMDSDT